MHINRKSYRIKHLAIGIGIVMTFMLAVLLVFAGTRLLGLGSPRRPHNDTDDLPPYQGQ